MRAKAEQVEHTQGTAEEYNKEGVRIIEQRELAQKLIHLDVSKYKPKNVPSLTWCECIKKIWKQDPLICPDCMGLMRIISFITEGAIIHKILKHLGLWDEERSLQLRTETARDPPPSNTPEIVWTPIDDGWHEKSLPTDFSTRVSCETQGWAVPDQPDNVG